MDELTLKVPRDGGVQKLAEILNHINDKCRLMWIVPSSSSLMETSYSKKKKNITSKEFEKLESLLRKIQHTHLTKIFRNSQSIANIVAEKDIKSLPGGEDYEPAVTGGECSTIIGPRPTAILLNLSDWWNYALYAEEILNYIRELKDRQKMKMVVLCDTFIEPRKLCDQLTNNRQASETFFVYDGGVREFDGECNPTYDDENTTCVDTNQLENWIQSATDHILVTHEPLYHGCEADVVVVMSTSWGGGALRLNTRSIITRAVSHVHLITAVWNNDAKKKLAKHFDIRKHSVAKKKHM